MTYERHIIAINKINVKSCTYNSMIDIKNLKNFI